MDLHVDDSMSDTAYLQEELVRRNHELQMLFDISSAIHSSPRLEDVLKQSLMVILKTFNFKMGVIYLAKDSTDDYWLFKLAVAEGFSSMLADSIVELRLSARQVERLSSSHPVRWFTPDDIVFPPLRKRMNEEQIRQIICISLFTQKGVLGVLYMTNDGPLQVGEERREFLTTIGQQIGGAIENAKLFDSIQRAKGELEISFDAIQHSIFIIDSKWRIFRINRTSMEIYGKAEDLVGKMYAKVLYESSRPPEDCPILECFKTGKRVQHEGPHPRWGGFYQFFAFPVYNLAGEQERVVYYEKDATDARKMEQRLQQSDRLKALGALAAGIAHEIRNPLATINFNTQILNRELALTPLQQQMFSDMVGEIKKIDRIVQQVLHFARPKEPQALPTQLNDIVQYCCDLSRVHLRKANIEVVLELANNLPLITMDFGQISQVVMNLVLNAIEAMPNGGRLIIKTKYPPDSSAVLLEVADTGKGILEEDKDRVFDPFFTRKSDGTGLGLSISRQILEKHGAYIELDSAPGLGAIFRVVFNIPG
jgi:nitrogen-specific signal transduction histidine kinase